MKKKESPLRKRQHQATAEAMLDAAEEAMVRRGSSRITMQEIARHVGCAPGTFYLYFKNKQELFEAILLRHANGVLRGAREGMDRAASPLEKVRGSLAGSISYWQGRGPAMRLALAAWPMRSRIMMEQLARMGWNEHAAIRRQLEDCLRQAQRKGLVRRDLPAETLHDFIDAVWFQFMEKACHEERERSVQEQMRVIWGLIAAGIQAREKP